MSRNPYAAQLSVALYSERPHADRNEAVSYTNNTDAHEHLLADMSVALPMPEWR